MLGLGRKKRRKSDDAALLHEVTGGAPLPTFPAMVTEALSLLHREDADLAQVAARIENDPGVTIRLLRIVNSSAFGLRHHVANVRHAVSILGIRQIEPVLVSCAVGDVMPKEPVGGWCRSRFWRSAARRATIAAGLADRVDPSSRSDCFTAALLQDVAVPLLAERQGERYHALLQRHYDDHEGLHALEQECFGWDHARIGGLFAREWQLPDPLAQAVVAHHGATDDAEPEGGLVLAQLVADLHEVDDALGVEELIENAFDRHGIPYDDTRTVLEQTEEEIESIASTFA